jgi:signal transduction histidine kinase
VKLASRLSVFFLAVQGVILGGFSAALYLLAADHLSRQVDARLDATLTALAAAAEVGPRGVKWEPKEREHGLGRDGAADQNQWVIIDDRGKYVDRSTDVSKLGLRASAPMSPASLRFQVPDGRPWRAKTRRLNGSGVVARPVADDGALSRGTDDDDDEPVYSALSLVAFAPLGPAEATLTRLVVTLTTLSAVLWVAAALAGLRICRRALAPLTLMATTASEADAADSATRLPVPKSRDEVQDLGRAFNGLLDRLHEALERQRRFTGDASHQLRTPLAGLLSQVDVALRRERPATEYRRVLGLVRTSAAELRQIVESLLFLARAESEAGRPELEVVDLSGWVPEHLRSWATHARASDITLEPRADEPLGAFAHPPLLTQLIDNLLENACKYSIARTPITIRLRREHDFVILAVEDRGCGLSEEEQERIFQPFYRGSEARARRQAGVGLGLTVAHRIATVFGGSIHVVSTPGVGSCFEVWLRARNVEAETRAESKTESQLHDESPVI